MNKTCDKLIIGCLATFADRYDVLNDTVQSILNQNMKLNTLVIFVNNAGEYPINLKDKYQKPVFEERGKFNNFHIIEKNEDYADNGKFYYADLTLKNYYFTFDDDLIYPPDYIENTVKQLELLDNSAIVSYHGSKLINLPIQRWYHHFGAPPAPQEHYACLETVEGNHEVDIVGTGTLAFYSGYFNLSMFRDFPHKYMADILVSAKAKRESKQMTVLAHDQGWIKYNEKMFSKRTIWDQFNEGDDSIQVKIINETWG